jgi:rSAM/selenodomain-associated transferase 1
MVCTGSDDANLMGLGTAVSIVCKTPGVGGGKSRLRPLLGAELAQGLSACFIRDVAAALEAVPEALGRQLYALFSPAGSEAILRVLLPSPWTLVLRQEASVGTVLQASMAAFLADGHDGAIMVNGDSPTLPTRLVEQAIAALREPGDRVVLGPALDGGYYLVGLKNPHPRLFEDIPWSTPEVLARTLRRADEIGVPVTLLPIWYDVDEPQDFLRLQAELSGQAQGICAAVASGPAIHTRAFLAALTHPLAVAP